MSKKNNTIILYPTNWLYNAGVVGFISTISSGFEFIDGTVQIEPELFSQLDIKNNYFDKTKIINLKGKNEYYPNFIDAKGNQLPTFIKFIKSFPNLIQTGCCHVCNNAHNIPNDKIDELRNDNDAAKKFFIKIKSFNMIHSKMLGPSEGEFPNGFWNMKQSLEICHLCNFILLHQHIPLTKLSDNSQIFINAPSFKVMYELNKLVKETYGARSSEESKSKREILATSVIEYSRKITSTLGLWTEMNIEIVTRTKEGIDFFSLPYEIIKIISDRNIAALLSELGEFKILNKVLDQNFSDLTEIAYLLLRESTKDFNDRNKDLIKGLLYRWNNQSNLTQTANKILKLYTLIENKIKRS